MIFSLLKLTNPILSPCRDVESGNRMVTEWYAKRQRGGVCAGYATALSDTVVPSRAQTSFANSLAHLESTVA